MDAKFQQNVYHYTTRIHARKSCREDHPRFAEMILNFISFRDAGQIILVVICNFFLKYVLKLKSVKILSFYIIQNRIKTNFKQGYIICSLNMVDIIRIGRKSCIITS